MLITHSHPFKGAHSHTKSEILVIDRLATFQVPDLHSSEDLHPMRPLLAVVDNEPVMHQAQLEWKQVCSLRAPPVFSLLF
ncbi:hypothetical protein EVA_02967 [gut metagenome]|uniref:Uncharacterized protein n=1 Tax=gut metagenome TaxID=749906 RepID=J9D7Y6_9ZZZZ